MTRRSMVLAIVALALAGAVFATTAQGQNLGPRTGQELQTSKKFLKLADAARETQTQQRARNCTPRYRQVCETIYKWNCRTPQFQRCLARGTSRWNCRKKHCRRVATGSRCRRVQVGTICDNIGQQERREPVGPPR